MTESGKEYTYRYDRRGNLTEEHKSGIPIRRYTYDATGRMVRGANLENREKTRSTYNALYMRTGHTQTLTYDDLNLSGLEDSLRFTSYAYDPVIGTYFVQARRRNAGGYQSKNKT